ncbi:ribosomal protein L7/L12 [Streptomyces sp. NPDC091027]|uniref:ribosomal protein L7/L12 n=1 Tax=Streptomyces sp. NPDC091027 TaxID=3365971 RepID=UPI0037F74BE3
MHQPVQAVARPCHANGQARHRLPGRTPCLGPAIARPMAFSCGDASLAGPLEAAGGGCVEEPGFRVLLTEAGGRKAEAIRAIRTVTGLGLWNSKLLLDSAPVAVTEPGWLEAAQGAAGVLEAAGARATALCDWCHRTTL